ncbi:toprim domain-containing protein [Micromonospora radicis]|uniref:hypothetical protein n=1 Tax=Micromonospora radicis TaxID=1894971 RepID=UPI0011C45733|nr:hypothetical protein [Micromonospora radicis]
MSPIASLRSADREDGIDLAVNDVVSLLLIFSQAWQSNDMWPTEHQTVPLTQSTILKRMDMLGFTERSLVADFIEHGSEWVRDLERTDPFDWRDPEADSAGRGRKKSAAYLRRLINVGDQFQWPEWSEKSVQLAGDLAEYWIDEYESYPRESTVIRTALRIFRPDERIFVRISQQALFDLTPSEVEWQEDHFPLSLSLDRYRGALAWKNTKPIVLVEGSFDCKVIRAAFETQRPDYVDCLSIADFTQGAEGGAGGLRRTLRTLAQLEIPNTIVGLFDNDAAGVEAIDLLGKDQLPPHIGYAVYPDLSLGRSYPTIGPTGSACADINGRALSIEHFLGIDCLAHQDGFTPVEWTGYNRRAGVYQGSVIDKARIQSQFDKKLRRARSGKTNPADDWTGLRELADFVINQVCEVAGRR